MTELNTEQTAALAAFAAKNGPKWKDKLADAWATGRDTAEPDGHALRQIRNRFGPSFLAKLPAVIEGN